MEGVIDEEEKIFFATKLNLFRIRSITLSKPNIFIYVIFGVESSTCT
jgi:hypothetical protein